MRNEKQGRKEKVLSACSGLFQLVKKLIFDKLTEVKEAPKTRKPKASAYMGTVVLRFAQ